MKKLDENLYKFIGFIVVVLLMINLLFPCMYMGLYKLIHSVDSSVYVRDATNGKFGENIFFNEEVESKTEIWKQLEKEIDELSEVTRIQDAACILIEHQDEVLKIIEDNEDYQAHLIDIGSSVEELIKWSEKISSLDDRLSMTSLYLTFLFISFVMVALFGFRKIFYVCAGITYIIAMLSVFSGGISDYLVARVLSIFTKLSSDVLMYRDMEELKSIFSQAFKESALTFIIFDVVVQLYQNDRKEKVEKVVRYLYHSLEFQRSYFSQFENLPHTYIARLTVPVDAVVKLCGKNIRNNNKKIGKKKLSMMEKNNLEQQNRQLMQLRESLSYIAYKNCEEHTTKEYISCLQQLQWLMYSSGMMRSNENKA